MTTDVFASVRRATALDLARLRVRRLLGAVFAGVRRVPLRTVAPDLLSFAGLACLPAAAWIALGIAAGLAVAGPALIVAGHALRTDTDVQNQKGIR